MNDEQFFLQHPDRRAHIRLPEFKPARDSQRAVRYLHEEELAFRSLGPHQLSRRRIILYRVPKDNPMWNPDGQQILKIPFLAFADETIVDEDRVLLPIIHQIMMDAAKAHLR
jgi:hypothetical protein